MTPPGSEVERVGRRETRQSSKIKTSNTLSANMCHRSLPYSANNEAAKISIKKKEKTYFKELNTHLDFDVSTDQDSSRDDTGQESHEGLSSYELERLENIRQNQAFLSLIKLPQATEALKLKSTQKGLKKDKPKSQVTDLLPIRKSMRLQKIPPNSSKSEVTVSNVEREVTRNPGGPIPMDPINVKEGSKLPAGLLRLWSEHFTGGQNDKSSLRDYSSALKTMRLDGDRVTKVVKERVFSAAFHPYSSQLLVAAGDKSGQVGLWDQGSEWGEEGVLRFQPHTGPVACMAFSTSHSANLISLSYDGTVRSADVEKALFDEVYRSDSCLISFDFLSDDSSSILVGDWDGNVAVVDRRTPGTSFESLSTLDPMRLRCVHVHPVHKQYFVASESRDVNIYDVRYLKKKVNRPVSNVPGHSLSISSAYFSPNTGNRVLTTCLDNNIRVFETSEFKPQATLLSCMSHNVQTGRWLTRLRALWDPKQEDCFVVGSMEKPRRVQVFHESGQLLHSFRDAEHLSTVCSVAAFHPSRNALVGGNGSGRLHLFTD